MGMKKATRRDACVAFSGRTLRRHGDAALPEAAFVNPRRFELLSSEPESEILSIELRVQTARFSLFRGLKP